MRWLAPQPLRAAKMFPTTHQTAAIPVFTAKSTYWSNAGVLQPTGIQPNLHCTKAAMRLRQQVGNGLLRISYSRRTTKTCPGVIIHQTLQMLCNLSVPLFDQDFALSLKGLHLISLSWRQTNPPVGFWRIALAPLAKANQIAKGCHFTNSANLQKDRSETITHP